MTEITCSEVSSPQLPSFDTELKRHEVSIEIILKHYRNLCNGKSVRMLKGKYKGRVAIINGVMSDGSNGRLCFLCMVQRVDDTGCLNSDGDSRSFLPREYFEFI